MTTQILRPGADVVINGVTAGVSEGSASLDAMAVPYATARLTLPLTGVLDIEEKLDPRDSIRGVLQSWLQGDGDFGDGRDFNLGVRSRRVDHKERTTEVELASDEALLIDYAPLTDLTGARAFETSVRGVCNYGLRTAITLRRNLAKNPQGTTTTGYAGGIGGGGTVSISTGPGGPTGLTTTRIEAIVTVASTSSGYIDVSYLEDVTAGTVMSVSAWAWASAGVDTQRFIQWLNASNVVISSHVAGSVAGFPTGTWTRVEVGKDLTVPDGAVRMRIIMRRTYTGSIAVGQRLLLTAISIEPGYALSTYQTPANGIYFDGNTAAGEGYATEWEGTAFASPSRMYPTLASSPAPDANVTAYWEVTNAFTNPAPASTTGYSAGSGTSAIAYTTFASRNAIRWTAATTGIAALDIVSGFSVQAGRRYKIVGEFGASVARQVGFIVRWLNANGDVIAATQTVTITAGTGGWSRMPINVTAPRTAVKANVSIYSPVNTAGQFLYASRLMWYEGTDTIDYFDGATAGTSTYTYVWADLANASASTRTPAVERDPDLFRWPAGTTAWDFLDPFTASTGLRLFCDEMRVWRLIDPSTYALPDVLTLSPAFATEGFDTIGLGDPEIYCTGVVITYKWTDIDGIEHTRKDTAGTGGTVLAVEINRPYPGSGVAAWMLKRRKGQGRLQEVTALTNLSANPGMQVSVSLPGTADQVGQLKSVEWGLTDGLMDVTTRALTDLIPGSIDALTGTIDALVGTIDSL